MLRMNEAPAIEVHSGALLSEKSGKIVGNNGVFVGETCTAGQLG